MAEGPLHVDPLLSYARRVDDQIRIVLQLADDHALADDPVFIRLQGKDASVRVRATVTRLSKRVLVEAEVAETELGSDIWRLKLRAGDRPLRNLQTRLVLVPGQPLALLPGRSPDTAMPEPEPRR